MRNYGDKTINGQKHTVIYETCTKNPSADEGLVIRHANGIQSQTVYGEPLSFKVISKKFLLGEK